MKKPTRHAHISEHREPANMLSEKKHFVDLQIEDPTHEDFAFAWKIVGMAEGLALSYTFDNQTGFRTSATHYTPTETHLHLTVTNPTTEIAEEFLTRGFKLLGANNGK